MIKKSQAKTVFTLVFFNLCSYALMSIYETTLPLYLSAEQHSESQIGLLIASGSAVTIFASLLWGVIADRSKYKNIPHIIAAIASCILFLTIPAAKKTPFVFILIPAFSFFLAPMPGLCDTITLEDCNRSGIKYGFIRIFASIIYGTIPFALLFTNNTKIIFPAYLVFTVLFLITQIFLSKVKGGAHGKTNFSLRPLFADKKLLILLFFVAVMNLTWYFQQTFFSIHITKVLGYDVKIWGIIALITIIGELPLFILYDRIFKNGVKGILLPSIILIALRYIIFSFTSSLPVIFITALITGIAPTAFTYAMTFYIDKKADSSLRASGITLIYSVAAVPRIIGFVFGSALVESLGTPAVLRIAAALWVIPLVIYLIKVAPDKSGAFDRP